MSGTAQETLGMLAGLASADVLVHPNRCVRVRNRNACCSACADACTTGAISLARDAVIVDAARCIGCGTCATACPTAALESANPSDDALAQSAIAAMDANDGEAVVMCARELDASYGRVDESKITRVTCLGRVDESLLLRLAAAGASDVALVAHRCDRCEHAAGRDLACAVAQSATQMLDAWGRRMPVEVCDQAPASVLVEGDLGSVDALGAPVDQTSVQEPAARQAAAPDGSEPLRCAKVGKNGALPQHVPSRRGRVLATLADMGPAPEGPVDSRLWGHVVIDTETCGSCRMCAVFCPTGALVKYDDRSDGTFGIEHDASRCVACGTCRDICPKGAVELLDGVEGRDLFERRPVRFAMRPRAVEPGKPDSIVRTMRGLLSDSQFVSQA